MNQIIWALSRPLSETQTSTDALRFQPEPKKAGG